MSKSKISMAVIGLAVLAARPGLSQTCSPAYVYATIHPADGSTHPPQEVPGTYITAGNTACQTEGSGWGTVTLTGVCAGPNYVYTYSGSYLSRSDNVSCSIVDSCLSCAPSEIDAGLYAKYGTFGGYVVTLPSTRVSGTGVFTTDGRYSAGVDPTTGYYEFGQNANHWGVPVFGDGHSPGAGQYTLQASSGERKTAVAYSSAVTPVDFIQWVGEPVGECSALPAQVKAPPNACGEPVSITSGNVFFSQTDGMVAAVDGDLQFVRSYNSVNRGDGLFGVFGRGWHHRYEQRLSVPEPGVLKLRQGNGRPIYFADLDGDLRYDPTVPYILESWIQKQPDGSYVRYLRKGGTETYDASGRLSTLVDASGNTTTLGYDGSGQLTTIAGAGGRALTLTYASGKIASLSGPAGTIATYTYDGSGRLARVDYADAAVSGYTFTYDPTTGAIATVSDLTGRTLETHTYDQSGRGRTSEISGGQELFTLTYLANQTQVTTVDGTTTYDFGSVWGQQLVTRVTGPCDSCGGASETQQWTYDSKGRVATHTDAEGLVTTYVYDPATGDLLTTTETKGATSRTTTYTYDASGRVLTVTAPDRGTVTYTQSGAGPTSIQDAINRTTNITYTPKGQLETVTNPRLKTTTFGYDPVTGDMTSVTDPLQKATTFGYDAMGRRNRVTDPLSNSTSYSYDVRAQLTRVTFPDTKFIAFTYDQGGRRTTVTDQLGRVTTYGYDSYGRLATVTDANTPAGVTRYGYDAMSHLTTITDARNKVTTFHYDAFGRVDSVSYPGAPALTETFTYYPTGRLKTRTDRNGLVATFTYDDLGRLAQKTYSDGSPSVTYSSDLADRLTSAVNAADNLTWVYDLAGQLESESSAANSSLVEYLYDGSANRTQLKLNGVVVLGYVYDDDDRLQAITRGSSSFGVTYDDASRRTGLNFPNSAKAAYTYDTKSRLTGITTTGLDSHGRTVTLTSSTYTYNAADNRLTKGGDFAEAYTYDPVYRLTQVKRGTKVSETYTYDGVGNRLSALNSSPWSYDDRNELLSYPTATFQYDLNGNATQRVDASGTWAYEWNAENQLTRVLKNGVEQARYAYDPIGRRVEKVAGTVTTAYLYDGPSILREMAGSAVTTYIQGPGIDEPIAREDAAGNRTYYHADGLGSLVKETNSAGTVTLTRKYDAFGSLQLGTNSGYAFTGREWESEVGLAYYRARYYDPKIGRFLSEDPIVIERRSILELNAYTYVGNSPTGYIDPYGLERRNTPYPPPPPMRGPGQIKDEAARRAQQRMRPDPNRSGGQDDEEDALRHCLAGCMMSRELGENVSFLFGFANEVKSDLAGTQTYEQRAMDLHNNAIGCAAASGARSTADCEQRCLQQMPVLIKHVGTGTPYP